MGKKAADPNLPPLDDPSLYVNRELSLLEFQRRVLEEAEDVSHPLLERIKFISILGSNLDEFFMVRVAGLKNQVDAGIHDAGADGMSPSQQLQAIRERVNALMTDAHACLRKLLKELENHGIFILGYQDLNTAQREYASQYFANTIFPVLTPLAYDPGRPFPHISNLSLSVSVLIRDHAGESHFARLKVPDTLPQLIPLQKIPKGNGQPLYFVWLEQVIQANLRFLFPGMEVLESHLFRLTRDADSAIQELEAEDLLETVEEGVRRRRFGAVVRLQVNPEMPESLLDILRANLELEEYDIYRIDGPLALSRMRSLASLERAELKDPPFVGAPLAGLAEEDDIFALIRRNDILLHHPFDSFQPVVDFLRTAARDPNVLAIKMTLYRVGRNAPVVEALLEAQENQKQVAVLVELKARFDEESNIEWARALEREGVHVVYGLVGLKIHGKVALVVRREGDVIRRYVHLSTGNYNAVTAHLYTDLGFFTADPEIGADATDLFNYLTGYSAKSDYHKLLVAPINLRKKLEALIQREVDHARAGRDARIIIKVNSLADPRIIRRLYNASQAGVQIELLVRGICCLRPGLPGVSDNIRVRSIVGRFLEHSRIFYFLNGGEEEVYLGSADIMSRNIDRRVEVLFPVQKAAMVRLLRDRVLAVYLSDNNKARIMQPDGTYVRASRGKGERNVNSQTVLLERKSARAAG
ncbi:MAG: polyphosphate kinase 1 [Bryobacteraceae bacterium]|nr:polyphosphate kinase 1 [Bryobacteraceae bacterium]